MHYHGYSMEFSCPQDNPQTNLRKLLQIYLRRAAELLWTFHRRFSATDAGSVLLFTSSSSIGATIDWLQKSSAISLTSLFTSLYFLGAALKRQ